ncbi:hypothetical protein ACFYO2_21360 [Streptomyces sp. NPDC006602]
MTSPTPLIDLADLTGFAYFTRFADLTGFADLTTTLTADRKDVPHP